MTAPAGRRGKAAAAGRQHNRILDALPAAERDRLLASMREVALPVRAVLYEPGAPVDAVHFPLSGVVSLVTAFADGRVVEVANVGNEGIVGVPNVIGGSLAMRAVSQVAGRSLRMPAATFLAEWERPGPLQDLVQGYVRALFGQVSQAAACNRLHSDEERLSRWLLMSQDRVGADEFRITRELLGQILGSRPARVRQSAAVLQAAGLVRYHRGRVTIVDRERLEGVSCECYCVIRRELDRAEPRDGGAPVKTTPATIEPDTKNEGDP